METVPTIQNGIAAILRADVDVAGLLPGGIWTRPIRRNDGTPEEPTPGSTPEAFDARGRIRRCAAILNGETTANPIGPAGAFYAFPAIWLRCLPHETEKVHLERAALRIITLLHGGRISMPDGRSGIVTVQGRMGPDDDPDLQPAVVDMIRIQVDSVWSVT